MVSKKRQAQLLKPGPADSPLKNIAIVAHVDAGKTSLSERVLYLAGAIPQVGEVDEGMSTLDFLEQEQTRGITIEAGMATFSWKGCEYTLVDTPGHVDFENEVDCALRAVEAAVLLISATGGLEVQTLRGWEKICKEEVLPLLFINKLDLLHEPLGPFLERIRKNLSVEPLPMTLPLYRNQRLAGVVDLLNQVAIYPFASDPKRFSQGPIPRVMRAEAESAHQKLVDAATEANEAYTEKVLNGESLTKAEMVSGLRACFAKREKVPVYAGAASSSVGVRQLLNGLHFFVPEATADPDPDAWGMLVRLRRWEGETLGLVKLWRPWKAGEHNLPDMFKVQGGSLGPVMEGRPGEILAASASLLPHQQLGEPLSGEMIETVFENQYLPLLKTQIAPARQREASRIEPVLRDMVAADPSLQLESEEGTGNWILATSGEVQLAVVCEHLQKETGCEIVAGTPEVQFQERLSQAVPEVESSVEWAGNTVHLKFLAKNDPESQENWLSWEVESSIPERKLPEEWHMALDSVFHQFCSTGVKGYGNLVGLEVQITSLETEGDTYPPQVLLAKALSDGLRLHILPGKVTVLEPVVLLEVTLPSRFCGSVLQDLQSKGAKILRLKNEEKDASILAKIPLQRIFGYTTLLRSLSKGHGTFRIAYDKHSAISA